MKVQNAKIVGHKLGVKHTDHGILSFSLDLDFGSSRQGFGGWVLDTNNPDRESNRDAPMRIPTVLGSSLLLAINQVFGCDWEELTGQPCRAAYNGKMTIAALGHYLEDKWLWYRDQEFVVTNAASVEQGAGE